MTFNFDISMIETKIKWGKIISLIIIQMKLLVMIDSIIYMVEFFNCSVDWNIDCAQL